MLLSQLDEDLLSTETYDVVLSSSETCTITIYDDPLGSTVSTTSNACFSSSLVWEGAALLSRYLSTDTRIRTMLSAAGGAPVLELGAGLGLVGITAALLGGHPVVLTDTRDALPLLEHNAVQNHKHFVQEGHQAPELLVREFSWSKEENVLSLLGKHPEAYQLILGSELMYENESASLLANVLLQLISQSVKVYDGVPPIIIFSHGDRKDNKKEYFEKVFLENGLVMSVLQREISPNAKIDDPEGRKYVTLYSVERLEDIDRLESGNKSAEKKKTSKEEKKNVNNHDTESLLLVKRIPPDQVQGTWGLPAFQLFAHDETHLSPATFPGLGFHCHPHIGIYGEDFTPAFPIIALSIPPTKQRLGSSSLSLPENVLHVVNEVENNIEYYFLVHSYPGRRPCQKFNCERNDEINLMLHPFLYQDEDVNEQFVGVQNVQVGVFAREGVLSSHLNFKDGGVPFDVLESRTCCIHDMCFSPCNMHIRVDYEGETEERSGDPMFAYFCTVAVAAPKAAALEAAPEAAPAAGAKEGGGTAGERRTTSNRGSVVTVHCVPLDKSVETMMRGMIASVETLEDLLGALAASDDTTILLSKLCGYIQ